MTDSYLGQHCVTDERAILAFSEATYQTLVHGRKALDLTALALNCEPEMSAAHALRGLLYCLQAKPDLTRQAATHYHVAARTAETTFEVGMSFALHEAIRGHFELAAKALDAVAHQCGGAMLAAKLSHQYRFMGGNPTGMLDAMREFVQRFPTTPGHSFALGCLSFALEEAGCFEEARSLGKRAVVLDSQDAWAGHAVIHTYEMTEQVEDGLKYILDHKAAWSECNNFGFHIEWHYGLFLLAQERIDDLLIHYDSQIRPAHTDDFRDFANASSMLWRIENLGHCVGSRWSELSDLAAMRLNDGQLTFYALHQLLVVLAQNDLEGGRQVQDCLERMAEVLEGEQQFAAESVGVPISKFLVDTASGKPASIPMKSVLATFHCIGGSHAQRDVFVSALTKAAKQNGLENEVRALQEYRNEVRGL